MCWRCSAPSEDRPRLSRRSFHKGVLAATIADPVAGACLIEPPAAMIEPRMRLAVPTDQPRTVALTLDACSGGADMRIIGTLIDLSVPATIFVTGLWLRNNPGTLSLLLNRADLFTLENHGEKHLPPILGNRSIYGLPVAGTMAAITREVERGADALVAAGGPPPHWYRGAAACYSPAVIKPIEAMGYRVAGYSLSADEGASLPAASVAHRMASAASGDVIIAHVNQPLRPSGAGVAAGVAALHAAGTVFVGLDALPVVGLPCEGPQPPLA
ncbi:MAG TPA: polysaccharide deacetylase [Acetobacteraceae bacterium]|jgi:peptidoglycan/xylan/chitin deacetylase (PgdA/CDA1 family)|nr:polysaccharide deacetylase [Acetobacteraceae bacterium]